MGRIHAEELRPYQPAAIYRPPHPAIYYSDVMKLCATLDVPYPATFPSALPNFVFVTPNNDDNMHTGTITVGDTWLSTHVPPLLELGAIVIITFDEGNKTYGQIVYTAEVGPGIPPVSSTPRRITTTHCSPGRRTSSGLGGSIRPWERSRSSSDPSQRGK